MDLNIEFTEATKLMLKQMGASNVSFKMPVGMEIPVAGDFIELPISQDGSLTFCVIKRVVCVVSETSCQMKLLLSLHLD